MRELTETEGILLDRLDEVEQRLLSFETAIVSNGDWRTLVHGLFRIMHNLKSSLSMSGFEKLGRLAHASESLLDYYRSGKSDPDSSVASLMLEALDVSRLSLMNDTELTDAENRRCIEVLENLEKAAGEQHDRTGTKVQKKEKPALEIPFSLDSSEMMMLQNSLASGKKLYILEKFVDSALTGTQLSSLPVFDAVHDAGTVIAWRSKKDMSDGAVLSILFDTSQKEEDLTFIIFDPFYQVAASEKKPQSGPVSKCERIPRFLIVDDDYVTVMILQQYLSPFGRIDTAMTGFEAVDKFKNIIKTDHYDAVFLDIMMPGMDGLTVLRTMRSSEEEAGIQVGDGCRVFMASALSDFPSISSSFRDLCDAYIVKPFDKEAVLGTVSKFGFLPLEIDSTRIVPS